jgi:hypothetical protein
MPTLPSSLHSTLFEFPIKEYGWKNSLRRANVVFMKQYRPDVERQKWLYSMQQSRAYIRRRQGKPEGNSRVAEGLKPIPDNSEPWLPDGVKSFADAIWISDQIKETARQWKIPLPQQ